MSDRFDHRFEHKLERKSDGASDAAVDVRRIELIPGTGRRRQWLPDVKARILLESFEPGANISEVARRNGLSPQQLFGWRRLAQDATGATAGVPAGRPLTGPSALAPQQRPRRGRPRLDRTGARTGVQPAVLSARQAPAPVFAPVVIGVSPTSPAPASAPPAPGATSLPGTIEIVVGDVMVRVGGQVDAQHIAAVLRAVRGSS